jgi:hypothetical protein
MPNLNQVPRVKISRVKENIFGKAKTHRTAPAVRPEAAPHKPLAVISSSLHACGAPWVINPCKSLIRSPLIVPVIVVLQPYIDR